MVADLAFSSALIGQTRNRHEPMPTSTISATSWDYFGIAHVSPDGVSFLRKVLTLVKDWWRPALRVGRGKGRLCFLGGRMRGLAQDK